MHCDSMVLQLQMYKWSYFTPIVMLLKSFNSVFAYVLLILNVLWVDC